MIYEFEKYLSFSFVAHLIVFLFLFIYMAFNSSNSLVVDNTLKVLIVAMPDKTLEELKVKEPDIKSNDLDFDTLMKEMSAKEIAKGNQLSQGASLTGIEKALEESVLSEYLSYIKDAVKLNWFLPATLKELSFQNGCHIRIYLNKDGKLLNTKIEKSSPITAINERALLAIKKSAPFKKVPKEVVRQMGKGVVLAFPL